MQCENSRILKTGTCALKPELASSNKRNPTLSSNQNSILKFHFHYSQTSEGRNKLSQASSLNTVTDHYSKIKRV